MSESEGFADLRLNRQEGQVNESFWPSFTDIMTVIVMIFLIAMVILLIRNMELVRDLRATMEAERIASELARATGMEKESLAYRLHQSQSRISELQIEVMRLRERDAAQGGTIAAQSARLLELEAIREEKLKELASLDRLARQLRDELVAARRQLDETRAQKALYERTISGLRTDLSGLESRLSSARDEAEALRADLTSRVAELDSLRQNREALRTRYQDLVGEHNALAVKYNRLVLPARSPKGRHLVEVRYWNDNGAYRISWREGDTGEFQSISRKRLELVLTQLKQRRRKGLYVKVIFPEQSGLTYNEAFEFTTGLHQRYDYYYQSAAEGTVDQPSR